MSDAYDFRANVILSGDKEVENFFQEASRMFTLKFTNAVTKKALAVTVKDAKARVKSHGFVDRGVLIRNIKSWTIRKGIMVGVYIKSQRTRSKFDKKKIIAAFGAKGFKQFQRHEWQKEPYYAYWIEFGHKDRGGNWIPGKPFWRPAWNSTKDRVLNDIKESYQTAVKLKAQRTI